MDAGAHLGSGPPVFEPGANDIRDCVGAFLVVLGAFCGLVVAVAPMLLRCFVDVPKDMRESSSDRSRTFSGKAPFTGPNVVRRMLRERPKEPWDTPQ